VELWVGFISECAQIPRLFPSEEQKFLFLASTENLLWSGYDFYVGAAAIIHNFPLAQSS